MTKEQKHQMDVRASKALANTDWREDNECNAYIDGYEQCIIDQRKIDVKEILDAVDACFDFEWDTLNYNNWRDQVIDAMKSVEGLKAMED